MATWAIYLDRPPAMWSKNYRYWPGTSSAVPWTRRRISGPRRPHRGSVSLSSSPAALPHPVGVVLVGPLAPLEVSPVTPGTEGFSRPHSARLGGVVTDLWKMARFRCAAFCVTQMCCAESGCATRRLGSSPASDGQVIMRRAARQRSSPCSGSCTCSSSSAGRSGQAHRGGRAPRALNRGQHALSPCTACTLEPCQRS